MDACVPRPPALFCCPIAPKGHVESGSLVFLGECRLVSIGIKPLQIEAIMDVLTGIHAGADVHLRRLSIRA
jgi:hypothetical protein